MTISLARLTFLVLIASLPIVRGLEVSFEGYPLPLSDFLFPLCAALWLAALLNRETVFRTDRFFLLLLGYWSVLALSAFYSVDQTKSLVKLLGETYLFGLCFLGFQLFSDEAFRPWVVKAWLAGTAVVVVGAAIGVTLFYLGETAQATNGFLSHFGSLPAGHYPRIRSTFANANMMANYMNISVMFLMIAGTAGWMKASLRKPLTALTWAAALLTLSPGIGGLALSAALWYRRHLNSAGRAKLAAAVLCGGLLFALLLFGATLVSRDTPNTDSDFKVFGLTFEPSVRVLVWESALWAVSENPLLGRGVGIDPASLRYETVSGDRQFLRDAHNIPLNVAGQSGLLGLSVFSLMILYLVKTIRDNAGSSETFYALAVAFVGTFLYQGLTGSFEDARHVWLLIGFLLAAKPIVASDVLIAECETETAKRQP